MEMSFIEPEDIQGVVERGYKAVFHEVMGMELTLPLPRMTWKYAMETYGSDKPDTRFGLPISDVNETVAGCGFTVFESALKEEKSVVAICAKGAAEKLSRKDMDALSEFVKNLSCEGSGLGSPSAGWHAALLLRQSHGRGQHAKADGQNGHGKGRRAVCYRR
jgi:aspartyl-tRNA synthetase